LSLDTSIDAFQSIKPELGSRQAAVYDVVRHLVNPTNLEISHFMGIPINQITPRIFELRKLGMIRAGGKRECKVSGRIVYTWRVK